RIAILAVTSDGLDDPQRKPDASTVANWMHSSWTIWTDCLFPQVAAPIEVGAIVVHHDEVLIPPLPPMRDKCNHGCDLKLVAAPKLFQIVEVFEYLRTERQLVEHNVELALPFHAVC